MEKYQQLLTRLMEEDPLRLQALECLIQLNLPDSYIAAGFVRNLVWDHLHNKTVATPLNDIDVIYFDGQETDKDQYKYYQQSLQMKMPQVTWQVRNQALMHERNGDLPYKSSLDAMRYWPEKETAVAIRMTAQGKLECISAFGFNSLFNLQLSHNPKRDIRVFEQRINIKGWFQRWPKLSIVL